MLEGSDVKSSHAQFMADAGIEVHPGAAAGFGPAPGESCRQGSEAPTTHQLNRAANTANVSARRHRLGQGLCRGTDFRSTLKIETPRTISGSKPLGSGQGRGSPA